MENKYIVSKGEHEEELTYNEIVKRIKMSSGISDAIKNLGIGEKVYYNDKGITFERKK